ncbi:MAG: GNAT family N-acetyltransferase [Phenylobacterium sp.]|uniref:GNAT family N-acetyltransferase n=1 Tax=Phenylobacterium sp. TaxID=1871053 RepID=UPI00273532EC|nr:GNAT family N-acetyltransferase [Phenylobacterium sp.]MDP3748184.1 GNAT family N-acetyltransferase [Phenylobacterium sp.]
MTLRRASAADAGDIARLHRLTMRVSLPYLPELHTPKEDLCFFRERLLPECETWVAEAGEAIAGYVAFKPGWIMHLYVHPEHQGLGIGPRLLAKALEDGTPRQLWTFQQNARARRFYEARGFKLVRLTDGADNEEKTPDALYAWEA